MKAIHDKPSPHNPGTPDDDVPPMRLKGRQAYRDDDKASVPVHDQAGKIEWWLGWYDERLRRFFGR